MQESITITNVYQHLGAQQLTFWGKKSVEELLLHPEHAGRLTIAVSTGCATLHLRPTVPEGRQMLELLQRALATFEEHAGSSYECHITCRVRDAEKAAKVAEALHWKTSEIARDPVLGADTYYYLTSHHVSYVTMHARMKVAVQALQAEGVEVVREKIEHIVYDTKRKGVAA